MAESYDYEPAPWAANRPAQQATQAYQKHVVSSYQDAASKGISGNSLIEPKLITDAQRPLIIVVDQTGSMGAWPTTMFSKLPYLDHEVRDYLGDDTEIAFMAIGDAQNGERYALQARPFGSGADLEKRLTELVIEGNGGANSGETYELAALYLLHNLQVDEFAEPVIIFIGDEPCFPRISVSDAGRWSQVKLEKPVNTTDVFRELREKASVYFIQKPYGSSKFSETGPESSGTVRASNNWTELVGSSHIARLADPGRVADVIFGILAKEVDRVDDFRTEIEGRQTKAQVKVVYESLATMHAVDAKPKPAIEAGKSRLFNDSDAAESSSLLGD